MSLILEALRKLDREKQLPERGFLVVGAAAWPQRRRRVWPWLAVGVAAAGLALWILAARPVATPATSVTAPVRSAPASQPIAPATPAPLVLVPAAPPRTAAAAVPRAEPPPVTAPAPAKPGASELVLQAISQRDGQPVAVINERLVHEGDSFDGVRVVKILDAEVEIEVGGRRLTLRF